MTGPTPETGTHRSRLPLERPARHEPNKRAVIPISLEDRPGRWAELPVGKPSDHPRYE